VYCSALNALRRSLYMIAMCKVAENSRRGIRYAAAYRFNHWRLWNTGSSACVDDDITGHLRATRARIRATRRQ
jgi:hypothetical protein